MSKESASLSQGRNAYARRNSDDDPLYSVPYKNYQQQVRNL
jgi:hypothetical protein